MGIALTEVGLIPFELTRAEIERGARAGRAGRGAHRLRLGPADHRWSAASSRTHGLLGPDQVHVHCNTLDDREFDAAGATPGAKVSIEPGDRDQMGMGHPVFRHALATG